MRPTVLLVDDEPDVLQSMHDVLADLDIDIRMAADGHAALDQLDVDVVVADHRMPGLDGVQLLREARIRDPDVRRILITAYADIHVAIQAVNQAHVDLFLRKPFTGTQLITAVQEVLGRRQVRMTRRAHEASQEG